MWQLRGQKINVLYLFERRVCMSYFNDYFAQTFNILKDIKNALVLDDIAIAKIRPNFNESLTFEILNSDKNDILKFVNRTNKNYANASSDKLNEVRRQKMIGNYDNTTDIEEKNNLFATTPNKNTNKVTFKKSKYSYFWI